MNPFPQPKSCSPERVSTFTGREIEINAIKSSLVEKERGIVSIIGDPGFCKSSIVTSGLESLK